jgi:hexosaminidase
MRPFKLKIIHAGRRDACVPANMMKSLFVSVFFVTVVFSGAVYGQTNDINIVPKPRTVTYATGSFSLRKDTKIVVPYAGGMTSALLLNEYLLQKYGFKLTLVKKSEKQNAITFLPVAVDSSAEIGEIKGEKYSLSIQTDHVYIGGTGAGQFYGIQSLLQMLPNDFGGEAKLPALRMVDSPRFPYRGMHLDVARHFMPVEFVKKYIDLMSQYKFNYFHWHLTEDQGWRIEIKKYPKLTEIGSKRSESHQGPYTTTFKGDGIPIEGYYTQEQIKDVVAYAKARYITVIPEIELPGHASAALAAYPQFGCKQDYKYEVKKTWGIFKEVYCPTDETFKFLEDVLDETIKLFPDSPYIHIGGDEVLKDHWKESAFVQELKKRENLKDEHEVQSYFIRRIEKFINSKGKKIIGWDEILEGGLAPNATVMSWRGTRGGIEAARAKHDVIMTPTSHMYFDYGQGDPAYEPLNIGSYIPLEKVYSFEPVPKELSADEAKYIIGGQANVWTEYMKTTQQVEYMAFPRMLALAEVLWSRPEDRNLDDFRRRLLAHLPRLDAQNVNYRIPEPEGLKNIVTSAEQASIELRPAAGTRVHYTTDGSTPDERSPVYARPVELNLKDGEYAALKTVVVNSKGRRSVIYAATIVRGAMAEAAVLGETKAGVNYILVVPPSEPGERREISGETRSIFVTQFEKQIDLKQPFSVQYDGYVRAAADGVYEFQADATWDTTIVLNGRMIIDDAGGATRKLRSTVVPLKAGWHKVSIRYNHRGGDAHFRVRFGIKGQGLNQIGGGELVH